MSFDWLKVEVVQNSLPRWPSGIGVGLQWMLLGCTRFESRSRINFLQKNLYKLPNNSLVRRKLIIFVKRQKLKTSDPHIYSSQFQHKNSCKRWFWPKNCFSCLNGGFWENQRQILKFGSFPYIRDIDGTLYVKLIFSIELTVYPEYSSGHWTSGRGQFY